MTKNKSIQKNNKIENERNKGKVDFQKGRIVSNSNITEKIR